MSTLSFGNECSSPFAQHEWGEWVEHEERGILVVTHGKRAGRVYATEQAWKERSCSKCQRIERHDEPSLSVQWPGQIR